MNLQERNVSKMKKRAQEKKRQGTYLSVPVLVSESLPFQHTKYEPTRKKLSRTKKNPSKEKK